MLDLLEDFMELRSIPYARLDGSTSRPRRTLDIKLVRDPTMQHTLPALTSESIACSSNRRNLVRLLFV
jgi:hypothetical protein